MTLLEYVQSLQEQGATDIPAKVQEWKKKNQPEVEKEVIETPVKEVKTNGAAETDAAVVPTPEASESLDSGDGSFQSKKDLFKPSEDIAALINFISPEDTKENKPVEDEKLTRIETYIKNDWAPDSSLNIPVPEFEPEMSIGDIDYKEALKDYQNQTGSEDGKIQLSIAEAKGSGLGNNAGRYDYIDYLKGDYFKQQAKKTVSLFEQPGFFDIPDEEVIKQSADSFFNIQKQAGEVDGRVRLNESEARELGLGENAGRYDYNEYLKSALGDKYNDYVNYKENSDFQQTVDQKELSKTQLLNAKIQRTILGSGGIEKETSFALKYFSPTFIEAKNLQSETTKLGDYITNQQKQIKIKSEALNKVAKPALEKLDIINGKIVDLLGEDESLTNIGTFNPESFFAKKELKEYTTLREEYQVAYDKYLELDIVNKSSALEKEQFRTSYLVDVYNNKIKDLQDSGEKADLLSKSLGLDYSNSARISASLHDTFIKGTVNFSNLVGQTLLKGIKYLNTAGSRGVMDGVIHQMQRMNYNYNKDLAEERELTLPSALTLDDIGKDGISFFDYSTQALSDQSGTLVLSMIPFGAGALTKAGGSFANLAARRSALLAQKNMGLFAANTVRTSFFAVESGSSFSDSITKKFEAIDKLDEFERKEAWGKLTPDDVQTMTTEKADLERHKNFSFAQMAFNGYAYGTVAMVAESLGTLKLPSILRKSAANYGARNLIKTATYKNPFQFAGWSTGRNIYRGLRPVITKAAPIEVLEETLTGIGHNMLDYWTLGENKSFFEGIDKDFLTKTLISTLAMTTPTTMGGIVSGIKGDFLSASEIQGNIKLRNELLNIEASLGTIGGKDLELAKKRKNEILRSFALNNASSIQKLNDLTPDQIFEIAEINRQLRDLNTQANLIGKSGDTSVSNQNSLDNIKKEAEALKYVKDQLLETRSRKNKLKAKSLNEQLGTSANIDLEYTLGLNDFATNAAMVLMNPKGNYITIEDFTDSQAITQTLKDNGYSDAQIENLLPQLTGDAPSNALQVGDDIIVNQAAIDIRMHTSASSAAQYAAIAPIEEIFHANVNSKNLRKKKNKDGSYEIDESATKAINDVVRILTDKKDQGIISEKDYNDLMSRFNLYKDGKGKVFLKSGERGAAGVDIEEVMAQINNAMVLGKIQRDDVKMMPSMRGFLNNTISSIMGDSSWLLSLDSASDVINFMSNFQDRVQNRTLKINTVEEDDDTVKESKDYNISPRGAELTSLVKEGLITNEGLVDIINSPSSKPVDKFGAIDAVVESNWPVISNSIKFNPTGSIPIEAVKTAVTEQIQGIFPGRKKELFKDFDLSRDNKVTTILGPKFLGMRQAEILQRASEIAATSTDGESIDSDKAKQVIDTSTTTFKSDGSSKKPIAQTDATSFGPAKNKKQDLESIIQVKDADRPNFKSLSNKYFNEVAENLFGIEGKKVRGNASLKYGGTKGNPTSSEANALQNVFKNSDNVRSFIKTMPKYNVATKETIINKQGESIDVSRDTYGRALGINPKVLEVFYDEVTGAIPDISSAKGRSLGKTTQPPVYKIKPEFDAELGLIGKQAITKLQSLIGVTPAGELSIPVKGPARTEFGSALTGLSKMYVDNVINTIGRSKLDSKQAKADAGAGKPKSMASKGEKFSENRKNVFIEAGLDSKSTPDFSEFNIDYTKTLNSLLKGTDVDRIDMKTKSGRKRFLDFAISSGLTKKLPPSFWRSLGFVSENLLKDTTKKFGDQVKESKEFIKELNEDPSVGEIDVDKNLRGYKGNLPFKNTTEAREWMSNSIEAEKKRLMLPKKEGGEDLTKAKAKIKSKELFAKDSDFPAIKNMLTYEGVYTQKGNLENELNNPEFVKRQNDSIDELGKLFEMFQNEVMRNEDGTMNFEGVAFVGALLSSSSSGQGHFLRSSAPFRFYEKGYMETGSGLNTLEHTLPATLVGKYLFMQALDGSIDENFKNIKNNYFQGPLSKTNDNKLKGKKLNGEKFDYVDQTPEGWKITDNIWARYFNINVGLNGGGINPSDLILAKGKSVYDVHNITSTGVKVDAKMKVSRSKGNKLDSDLVPKAIAYDKPVTTQTLINALIKTDKSLNNARKLDQPVKKIRVFDFDDTLARSKSMVIVVNSDGTTKEINATQFAQQAADLESQGAEFDFSEFSKVVEGKKGPLFEVAKIIADKRGTEDVFILTARPQEAAGPIKAFMKANGIDIPLANITGLGDGTAEAKAGWMMGKAAEGYNDFYFTDDAVKNVKAVEEVLSQVDVKSKVQLAKASKGETFNTIANDMIEDSSGIETYKKYSAARAKTVGANKGRFNFFIPPSAEDFTGLLYKMLGKGKKGDAQMAFLKANLLDPYDRAESAVTQAKISAANDFKALKTQLKTLPTSLSVPTGVGGFTYSHAVRVAIWTAQGMEIPGLSKRDIQELNDFIKSNDELKTFANELIVIQKGKPYPKPGKDWLGGNITSDIINDINKVNRAEYQQEWRENVDIIFSEDNMNKMEAAYGTRWREAMEDSLRRMKSGSNRPPGGNRSTDAILDWLNNSVGAVMFLNTRSALLQTISAVNFINWGDNNIVKAGAAFANQKQYWKDYMTLMNSDYLVERRNGLKINVSESELADAVRDSGNKPKAAIAFLLSKGFVMTRFADSFAIASGGSTFYRNRIKALVAKGMDQKAAEAQAFEDFRQIAEESQQSSNPNRISAQQASAAGRVILAWANTPMQYARIQKRAAQDLINGRGDWRTNVSKIVYYGAIQNLIFNSLQQAVFALGFGEDDEEKDAKKNEKISRVANGMIDSQLKGLGIGGAAVLALKSALMELGKQYAVGRPEYEEAVFDLLNFSPPLGSKINKIRGGLRSFSWNMEDMKEKGFSLDNPAYLAGAQIATGLTNVPLDRVAKKINNVRGMVNEQSALWQKVALGLGWSTWDLGLGYYGGFDAAKVLTAEEEKVKEIDDMKKLTKTKEQIDMLLDLGLSKQEIKALGKEQARVEKIIELQNAEAEPKKEAEVKEEIKEETKPTPVAKPKPTPKPKVKTVSAEARLRRQFDSIKDENKPDQVKTLLKFGLSKKEILDLKYEKNRVEKILELMPKNK